MENFNIWPYMDSYNNPIRSMKTGFPQNVLRCWITDFDLKTLTPRATLWALHIKGAVPLAETKLIGEPRLIPPSMPDYHPLLFFVPNDTTGYFRYYDIPIENFDNVARKYGSPQKNEKGLPKNV